MAAIAMYANSKSLTIPIVTEGSGEALQIQMDNAWDGYTKTFPLYFGTPEQ